MAYGEPRRPAVLTLSAVSPGHSSRIPQLKVSEGQTWSSEARECRFKVCFYSRLKDPMT
jgi:hypothetical protein